MIKTTFFASLFAAVSTFATTTLSHTLPSRQTQGQCSFTAWHRQHCDSGSGTTINYIQINEISGPEFSINVRQQRGEGSYNSYTLISNQRPLEITGLPQDTLVVKTKDANDANPDGVLFEYGNVSWTPEDEDIAQVKCEVQDWDVSDWQCASGSSDNSKIARQRRFVCSFDCEASRGDDRLELV